MARWTEMSGGARAGLVALGVAGVAVAGALVWRANQPVAVATLPAQVASPSEPVAAPAPAPEVATPLVTQEPANAAPIAPSFDNWRVEGDGSAVVSGRAEPAAKVAVLVDGAVVAETLASGSGAFALLFTLAPNDKPSIMMLEATLADGTQILSEQTIALAPIAGPAPAEAVGEDAAPPAAVVVTEDTVTVVQPLVEAATEGVTQDEPATNTEPAPETAPDVAAEAPVAAILIDAISYNAAGDVLLSGKGQAGQFVRVYLDNALTATAGIAQAGTWQVTLMDAAPGLYTLRVDQIDAQSKVTARYETPFQRETREALAALAKPAQSPQPESESEPEPTPEPAAQPAATEPPQSAQAQASAPVPPAESATVAATAEVAVAPPTPVEIPELAPEAPAPAESAVVAEVPSAANPAPSDAVDTAPVVEAAAPPPEPVTPAPEVVVQSDPAPQPAPVVPSAAPEAIVSQTPEPQPLPTATAEAAPAQTTPPVAVPQPAAETAPPPVPATVSITVQPGYTLWGIARASLGNGVLYVQVFNANKDKIRNPDLIYPGQVFTLPVQ